MSVLPPDAGAGMPELIIRVRYEGSPIADVRDERGQHLQVLSVSDVPAVPELARDMLVSNLAMLVRRLASMLRKSNPVTEFPDIAMEFLKEKGLQGDALRSAMPIPSHDEVRRVEGLPFAILDKQGRIVEERNADGTVAASSPSGARTPEELSKLLMELERHSAMCNAHGITTTQTKIHALFSGAGARTDRCPHGFTKGACEAGHPGCACADEAVSGARTDSPKDWRKDPIVEGLMRDLRHEFNAESSGFVDRDIVEKIVDQLGDRVAACSRSGEVSRDV